MDNHVYLSLIAVTVQLHLAPESDGKFTRILVPQGTLQGLAAVALVSLREAKTNDG